MRDLSSFAENIWIVDGANVRDFGLTWTTRMTIVRLSDGSLWVNSPVPVSFDRLQQIVGLGPVSYLVAATPRHVWRLEGWHTLFPEAQVWTARPTIMTLRKGRLPIAGVLGDAPPLEWADDLDQLAFKGNPLIEEVFFFHRASRSIILDDMIQNHPAAARRPLLNRLLKLAGVAYPRGGVPLDIRLTFTNRRLARQSLEKLLSWDFDRLVIAHGACVERDAKPFVERAFQWLNG
ncbi:MAG TPA: DUF4336 domain-containing protein [Armatimonadota bacterium]|nr:DUF4336 domain-containing protein [Armatimonadota bacterium]